LDAIERKPNRSPFIAAGYQKSISAKPSKKVTPKRHFEYDQMSSSSNITNFKPYKNKQSNINKNWSHSYSGFPHTDESLEQYASTSANQNRSYVRKAKGDNMIKKPNQTKKTCFDMKPSSARGDIVFKDQKFIRKVSPPKPIHKAMPKKALRTTDFNRKRMPITHMTVTTFIQCKKPPTLTSSIKSIISSEDAKREITDIKSPTPDFFQPPKEHILCTCSNDRIEAELAYCSSRVDSFATLMGSDDNKLQNNPDFMNVGSGPKQQDNKFKLETIKKKITSNQSEDSKSLDSINIMNED
jgi:hypothetical protein